MNKREWMLQASLIALGQNQIDWMAPYLTMNALGAVYDAIIAATPETAQEGAWVEHDGDVSKAPEEGRVVEVMFRDGRQSGGYGGDYAWDHDGQFEDVVRWRYA